MKTFNDYEYIRPDFENTKKEIREYIDKIKNAQNYEEMRKAILEHEEKSQDFQTNWNIAYIRNGINTLDKFYQEELNILYSNDGDLTLLEQEASAEILKSKFLCEFQEEFGKLSVQKIELSQKLASPLVVKDMERESQLCQEYNRVIATCKTQFNGAECNITGMLKYMQSTKREERKEAFDVWAGMYESVSEKLNEIYEEMIVLRKGIAEKLGFDSYISFIYARMGRFDYTAKDTAVYRKQVAEHIVPLCERLFKEQADRLGLDSLEFYDEKLTDPDGNAVPQGDMEQMIQWSREMYSELSPETEEFINFLIDHRMFDLQSKVGKQPGGYCAFLPSAKTPFIFANFNGTSADVDVLTHEAGHAFESYTASRTYPLSSMVWASSETNEIHSMSMEFFTYPWMEKFFGDKADRYRIRHLAQALEAIPYMVCVDEIQHRVYEENLDLEGRCRVWKELEAKYMPWRSYDDNEFLSKGWYWMLKAHIFINPFYYIEYALAQISAFEFYEKMDSDYKKAWQDYCKLCKLGGSLGYFDTLKASELNNPFKEGTVKKVTDFLQTKLFN